MSGYGRVCAFKVEPDVFKEFHQTVSRIGTTEGAVLRALMKDFVESARVEE